MRAWRKNQFQNETEFSALQPAWSMKGVASQCSRIHIKHENNQSNLGGFAELTQHHAS